MMMKNTLSKFSWLVIAIIVMLITSSCGGDGGSISSNGQTGRTALDIVYTYDELNRLTSVHYSDGVVVSYTYDAAGNILSGEVLR